MTPQNQVPLSKISAVTTVFKHFPQPVFRAWLSHRREAADVLCPEWRRAPKVQRVLLLDRAASIWAQFN